MFHTYILYPLGVIIFSKSSKKREPISFNSSFQPHVAVVFAAYNEESVIKEKIDSIYNSEYPATKISVYIGSDASTDTTDIIVKELQSKYSNLSFVRFNNRTGKSGIINQLFEICKEDIVIGTDANIIFNEKTISNFVRHFNDANTSKIFPTPYLFKSEFSKLFSLNVPFSLTAKNNTSKSIVPNFLITYFVLKNICGL